VTGYVALTDIARRVDVGLSAVSNWRTRYADFPEAHDVDGREVFVAAQVATWLRHRRVPRHRLKPGESPGATYGDRFQRGAETPQVTMNHEAAPADPDPSAQLWAAADRLRDTRDTSTALELIFSLVYVKTCQPEVWARLVEASDRPPQDWPAMRDMLARVSLSMGEGGPLRVFGKVDNTYDPSLCEAVQRIDRLDVGPGRPVTVTRFAEAILARLERRLGRNGGHFTPPDVARCLVELLDPQLSDTVFDPFCGSGELLSAAAEHVRGKSGWFDRWRVYGQAAQEQSWMISGMNLALHGVEADLGRPAATPLDDRFGRQQFSRILANPPFNLRVEVRPDGPWPFGVPPAHNANFAWLQHAVNKLAPGGRAAVLMPDGAAFVEDRSQADIRRRMVEDGVVESVIALPAGLFRFTGIATTIWILRDRHGGPPAGEVLFIDGRNLGEMVDRARRQLREDDIEQVVGEYRAWRRTGAGFTGTDGLSRAVGHDEIRENDYILLPKRYVGPAAEDLSHVWPKTDLVALRAELEDLGNRAMVARKALSAHLASAVLDDRLGADGRYVPLGTVCDVLSGPGTVARKEPPHSGTPVVLPRNVDDNRIGHEGLDVVGPDVAERMARYRLAAGDIVTARAGTLGRYGLVGAEQTGWLLGPGCVRFRPTGQLDPAYLIRYLDTPAARQWLTDHATGSTIRQINSPTLRTMPIWLLPLAAQRQVVEVLEPVRAASTLFGLLGANAEAAHRHLAVWLMAPPENMSGRRSQPG
jgi:type I restriction enzyme M protein